jgi:hypothetical protein
MITALQDWLDAYQTELARSGITISVSPVTQGLSKNSIHAEFRTERQECTVQLWETGEADVHFLDWEASDDGVTVRHYEFGSEQELRAVLEELRDRMSSHPTGAAAGGPL